jgi:hypothetical protein
MSRKNADISFGLMMEGKVIEDLRKIDNDITKTKFRYDPFDFVSENSLIELKSRRILHNAFDEVMIGKNKILKADKSTKSVYFAFNYLDGIWVYKYDKKDLDNGGVYFAMGGRCDRDKDERMEVAYIKRDLLYPL